MNEDRQLKTDLFFRLAMFQEDTAGMLQMPSVLATNCHQFQLRLP